MYYHEDYEGPRLGHQYGDRVKNYPAACGRRSLKLHDNNNVPFFGGRTRTVDNVVKPDWYNAKRFNWVGFDFEYIVLGVLAPVKRMYRCCFVYMFIKVVILADTKFVGFDDSA